MIKLPARNTILAAVIVVVLSLAVSCGNDPTGSDSRTPASISVSTARMYLKLGESAVVTVEVLDQHGRPITDAVSSWSSSNVAVASIGGRGALLPIHSEGPKSR